MENKPKNLDYDTNEIDSLAIEALKSRHAFEVLFTNFKPYLSSQAAKWSGSSSSVRDDMMSAAMQAFHETIKSYDPSKGHFYSLLKNIVHKRLIDSYRNLTTNKVETVPLELETEDGVSSYAIAKASIKAHEEGTQHNDLVSEIEEFKQELAQWGITMDILSENSPKQARTRAIYKEIAMQAAADSEILRIVKTMHYFPVKKVKSLTKSPQKTIERARIYIIAHLIIHTGDYEYLKGYIN